MMVIGSGAACKCAKCGDRWFDHGVCQGCHSDMDIEFAWFTGRSPAVTVAPRNPDTLTFDPGIRAQLITSWNNLVLVRGLTPFLRSATPKARLESPGWYVKRGVNCTVQFATLSTDPNFAEKFNHASRWTNQSFIVRLWATFEDFSKGAGSKFTKSRLLNARGLREFHHAYRMRNSIAHGEVRPSPDVENEAMQLFGSGAVDSGGCRYDIDAVHEPLWARLLMYAMSCENGVGKVPADPAVVVAIEKKVLTVQTFRGIQQVDANLHPSLPSAAIGDIISL